MTMYPMVIFVLFISFLKFGPFTPSVMDNRAEAAMTGAPNYQKEAFSLGIFSAVKDWRQSKIIRTSLNYDPALFYDLNDTDIRKLFGEPSLSRHEGKARMIQYTYQGCVADFYYMSGTDQKISHYEIRQLKHNQASNCLSAILNHL